MHLNVRMPASLGRQPAKPAGLEMSTLLVTDRGYPKKLAYQYLEDLHQEFTRQYGHQIETAARPYAFIKFGKDCFGNCLAISQEPAGQLLYNSCCNKRAYKLSGSVS